MVNAFEIDNDLENIFYVRDDGLIWVKNYIEFDNDNYNTAIGYLAGEGISNGAANVCLGYQALYLGTTSTNNVAIGKESLKSNSGNGNVAVGSRALFVNSSGNSNVSIGYCTGYSNSSGKNNTFIGSMAGYSNVGGNSNVFIGYQTGFSETNSNKLYIDNSATATPLIYGEFDNDKLIFNCASDLAQLSSQPTGGVDLAIATTKYVNDKHWIMPSFTTLERNALSGVNGMIIYNSTTNQFNFYENGSWVTK